MLEVISLSIASKLAIEILISKTNGQISRANAMSITMAKDLDQIMMKDLKTQGRFNLQVDLAKERYGMLRNMLKYINESLGIPRNAKEL